MTYTEAFKKGFVEQCIASGVKPCKLERYLNLRGNGTGQRWWDEYEEIVRHEMTNRDNKGQLRLDLQATNTHNMTNKEIINNALAEIKNEDTFRKYNMMLDIVFHEHVHKDVVFAMYLSNKLWDKHTEDITLDDISLIQSSIYEILHPKQTQEE